MIDLPLDEIRKDIDERPESILEQGLRKISPLGAKSPILAWWLLSSEKADEPVEKESMQEGVLPLLYGWFPNNKESIDILSSLWGDDLMLKAFQKSTYHPNLSEREYLREFKNQLVELSKLSRYPLAQEGHA